MEFRELEDIAIVKGGKRLPKGHQLVDYKTKHPYLRITDYSNGYVDLKKLKYISDETYEMISRYIINERDVFLSIVGTIGMVDYIDENLDGANLTENAVKIQIEDTHKYNPLYLSYYLKSPYGQHEINSRTVGSTQKKLAIKRIRKILVPNIDIEIQNKIASILNNYDKKIETNNKIIANLEAQAQALFKYYFVDFETFADGNFVDSELGPIPEGWNIVSIGHISKLKSGKRPKRKTEKMSIPIIGANGITGYCEDYLYDENVIVTGRVGTLGVVRRYHEKIWASDNALVFTSQDYFEYLYFQLLQVNYNSLNRGSTQPLISQKDIKNIKIVLPNDNDLIKFQNIIKNIFELQNTLKKQNQTLAQARDALLPRLMAGEIDLEGLGGSYDWSIVRKRLWRYFYQVNRRFGLSKDWPDHD